MGAWNEPTLRAREWRSATLEALGANGSCTSTTSIGSAVSTSSIVLATSTAADAHHARSGRRQQLVGVRADQLAAGADELLGLGRRDDQQLVPAALRRSETRATYSLTSLATSHANGVTWAITRP